jgi:hypothetical protein
MGPWRQWLALGFYACLSFCAGHHTKDESTKQVIFMTNSNFELFSQVE